LLVERGIGVVGGDGDGGGGEGADGDGDGGGGGGFVGVSRAKTGCGAGCRLALTKQTADWQKASTEEERVKQQQINRGTSRIRSATEQPSFLKKT
jgi:hypothetical protein